MANAAAVAKVAKGRNRALLREFREEDEDDDEPKDLDVPRAAFSWLGSTRPARSAIRGIAMMGDSEFADREERKVEKSGRALAIYR